MDQMWPRTFRPWQDRRRGLERWLQGVVAVNATSDGAVAKFLLLGRCGLQPLEPLEPSAPEMPEEECQVPSLGWWVGWWVVVWWMLVIEHVVFQNSCRSIQKPEKWQAES